MLALVASFLAGVVVTVLVTRLLPHRRTAAPRTPRAPRINERDARIEESITAFGEQLETLVFDPTAAGHTEAMLDDYRAALDAYEKAKAVNTDAPKGEARVVAALGKGHAALIRLDARINHRPVPIEAIEDGSAPTPELRAAAERFLTSGKRPGVFEILLDRPEPEKYAIAEIDYRGDANFFVRPMTRTEGSFETHQTMVNAQRSYKGRHLVDPSVTHFKIEMTGDSCKWSVRMLPTDAALPLEGERHGREANEVLAYDGARTKVSIQVRTRGTWRLTFQRPAPARQRRVDPRPGRRDEGTPGAPARMADRRSPGRGLLVGSDSRLKPEPRASQGPLQLGRGRRAGHSPLGGGRARGDLEFAGKSGQLGDPADRAAGRKRDTHGRVQGLGVLPDLHDHPDAGAVTEPRPRHVHDQ